MKKQQSTNSQRQNLNLDTSLFENRTNNLMDGQKTQKISDKIKHQISTQDFSLEELTEIFDVVSKKLIHSLFTGFQSSSKEVKFYGDQVKKVTTILRSFLFRLNLDQTKDTISISIGDSERLMLRTMSGNPTYRYWYLDSKNIGRDNKETRNKIESEFNISFSEIAPDLPPPLEKKKGKITLKKASA